MKPSETYTRMLARSIAVALLAILTWPVQASMTISDNPLFVTVTVPPNVTLTLDDSGSMQWAFTPDICGTNSGCNQLNNRWAKSAHGNPQYYNPNVIYTPPKNADGSSRSTSFTAAWRNGFYTSGTQGTINFGATINLTNAYRPTAALNMQAATVNTCGGSGGSSNRECFMGHFNNGADLGVALATANVPAYYYVFNSANANCDGTATDNDCYNIIIVSSTSGPGSLDINGDGVINASDKDERQNFANWYSFYRTRNLATISAATLAFSGLDASARVAWQALNSCRGSTSNLVDSNCDGWSGNLGFSNAIRPFAGTHKNNFYNWLFSLRSTGGTPLPTALNRVGDYYMTSGDDSPYDDNFTALGSTQTSCRKNYHILMTDGIWNGGGGGKGNLDNSTSINLPQAFTSATPNITSYAPIHPYRDGWSNTLADSAFYYWITDLRSDLPNNLTPRFPDLTGTAAAQYWNPRNNPATWQHMVNYTIGLGLTGYLAQSGLTWTGDMYGGSFPDIVKGTTPWPQPANDSANNVADLWHAAINSRGIFFSADDPASLSAAFKAALTDITDDSGSSAALSANSTSLQSGTVVYQAKFNSKDWSGTLLGLPVFGDGSVGSPNWDAGQLVPGHATRSIFTYNGTAGIAFNNCAILDPGQQALLSTGGVSCTDRLNWLRGDASKEQPAGPLRKRSSVMADIINSDPAFVKNSDFGFAALPVSVSGQSSYAAYVTANASRQAMVYVGTNGGTLEAINADTGVEVFAYVPGGVYDNLHLLTSPTYTHRFYVDGAPSVSDAYLSGTWKTVLVGGLNAGGNSIYALDITNPTGFNASNVMWEFNHTHMGLSYSQPQIGILESGEWVAVFGNGYNSAGGGAYLYVVSLANGNLIRVIQAMDIPGDENNGLSTPILHDSDGNGLMDTVYAGDLHGNLWKFDLSDSNDPLNWDVAFTGSPLFRACRDDNNNGTYCEFAPVLPPHTLDERQPITAQPKVTSHAQGGHMVVFGTGRYLTSDDVSDPSVQSFYGIRDNGSVVANITELQQQTVSLQTAAFGFDVRSVSTNSVDWNTKKGWYLNLPDAPGERVVSTPLIKANRAIFVTTVPSTDPCSPGGYSWLMEIDMSTGGAPPGSVFDFNNDNLFDSSDMVSGQVVAGLKSTVGLSKTPVWLEKSTDIAFKIMTGTSGGFMSPKNNPCPPGGCPSGGGSVGRVYWMQIR